MTPQFLSGGGEGRAGGWAAEWSDGRSVRFVGRVVPGARARTSSPTTWIFRYVFRQYRTRNACDDESRAPLSTNVLSAAAAGRQSLQPARRDN